MLHADFGARPDEGFCVPVVRRGGRLEVMRAKLMARAKNFDANDRRCA